MNPFPIIRRKRKVKPRQGKNRLDNFMVVLQEALIRMTAQQPKNDDREDTTSMRDEDETDADEAGFSSDEDDFCEDYRPRLDVQNLPSSSEQYNAADVDGHIDGEIDSLASEEDPVETEAEYYTDSSYASPIETSSENFSVLNSTKSNSRKRSWTSFLLLIHPLMAQLSFATFQQIASQEKESCVIPATTC